MEPIGSRGSLARLDGTSVVVTGATGFVGGWVAVLLARLGARVSAWGRSAFHDESPVALLGARGIERYGVDLADLDEVRGAMLAAEPALVVHLAAETSVRQAMAAPWSAFRTNAVGTLNLCEAIRSLPVCPSLILSSSHMAVAASRETAVEAMNEDSVPSASDPYGTSKAAAELVARCYAATIFAPANRLAVVRFANVVGFGDRRDDRVIQRFIGSAKARGSIELSCRLNGRQFIDMRDLLAGLLRVVQWLLGERPQRSDLGTFHFAIERYDKAGEPFIRMQDLAALVASLTGARVDASGATDWAPHERRIQALACAATSALLGWHPRLSLQESVRRMLGWHDAHRAPDARIRMAELMRADADAIMESL